MKQLGAEPMKDSNCDYEQRNFGTLLVWSIVMCA